MFKTVYASNSELIPQDGNVGLNSKSNNGGKSVHMPAPEALNRHPEVLTIIEENEEYEENCILSCVDCIGRCLVDKRPVPPRSQLHFPPRVVRVLNLVFLVAGLALLFGVFGVIIFSALISPTADSTFPDSQKAVFTRAPQCGD